ALVHAERAIACGAEGETLGRLRLVETTVCSWRGDSRRADEAAQAALALLPRGGPEYYTALQLMADGTVRLAMPERAPEALELLMAETRRGPDHLIACIRLLLPMFGLGMRAEAMQLMNAVIIPSAKKTKDPSALAHVYAGRGSVALYEGNPAESFEFMEKA